MRSAHDSTTPTIRHILGGVDEKNLRGALGRHVEVAEVNTEYERQREERATLWWCRKAVQAHISGNLNLTLGCFRIYLIICILRICADVRIAQIGAKSAVPGKPNAHLFSLLFDNQ